MTPNSHSFENPTTANQGFFAAYELCDENVFARETSVESVQPHMLVTTCFEDYAEARDRITFLLKEIPSQAKIMLSVIDYCKTMQPVDEVKSFVDALQVNNKSVFSYAVLSNLLLRAGALNRVVEDGSSFEEVNTSPQTVVVDGVECIVPQQIPNLFWVTTAAGLQVFAEQNSQAALAAVLQEEARYLPIYKHILRTVAEKEQVSTTDLRIDLDAQPLLQNPRLFTQHFINLLEQHGAIEWAGSWIITDLGREFLRGMHDVEGIQNVKAVMLPDPEIDAAVFA